MHEYHKMKSSENLQISEVTIKQRIQKLINQTTIFYKVNKLIIDINN